MAKNFEENEELYSLHRCFVWANKMRTDFDAMLNMHQENKISEEQFKVEGFMYMSLWYGLLYVVIEGYRKLKFQDAVLDELLKSNNVELLRKYRNGTFHFHKKYNNVKFEAFFVEKTTVEWIRKLNLEFGRFFLKELT